jgi:hypothetical protein
VAYLRSRAAEGGDGRGVIEAMDVSVAAPRVRSLLDYVCRGDGRVTLQALDASVAWESTVGF